MALLVAASGQRENPYVHGLSLSEVSIYRNTNPF